MFKLLVAYVETSLKSLEGTLYVYSRAVRRFVPYVHGMYSKTLRIRTFVGEAD